MTIKAHLRKEDRMYITLLCLSNITSFFLFVNSDLIVKIKKKTFGLGVAPSVKRLPCITRPGSVSFHFLHTCKKADSVAPTVCRCVILVGEGRRAAPKGLLTCQLGYQNQLAPRSVRALTSETDVENNRGK